MSMPAEIVVSENTTAALSRLGSQFAPTATREMGRFGQEWVSKLVTQRLSGRPGLNRRTGNLARSFKSRAYQSAVLGGVVLDVQPEGPGSEYASIHEFGGIVRPVHSKYLWIPIGDNLTSKGVARLTPTQARERGGFIINSRRSVGGKVFMGYSTTKAGRKKAGADNVVPLFALKPWVMVPPRLRARALWSSSMPSLTQRLDTMASQLLAKEGV